MMHASRSSIFRRRDLLSVIAMAVAVVGCGQRGVQIPNRVPVSGRVMIDGKPLEYGTVQFVPENPDGHPAIGRVQSGRFTMASAESFPGVVKGPYKVSIVSPKPVSDADKARVVMDPDLVESNIPKRYWNLQTSGLAVDVTGPIRDLTFDLKAE